jgi:hypothetical protein
MAVVTAQPALDFLNSGGNLFLSWSPAMMAPLTVNAARMTPPLMKGGMSPPFQPSFL